jgi:hypothetical protein
MPTIQIFWMALRCATMLTATGNEQALAEEQDLANAFV